MSWFSSTQLSSFAKQALTTAQKSIDRVLDIKEDEWGDTVVMPYDDLPGKTPLSGGWGMTQWDSPPEECTTTLPPSSEAITTPVTRMVVDETENFFSAFLPSGELQSVMDTQVVSVPPTKSHRRPQEKDEEDKDTVVKDDVDPHKTGLTETNRLEDQEATENQAVLTESSSLWSSSEIVLVQTPDPPVLAQGDSPDDTDSPLISESWIESTVDDTTAVSEDAQTERPFTPSETQPDFDDHISEPAVNTELEPPFNPSPPTPPREILLEAKDPKAGDRQSDTPSPKSEDRQSNTPSPPVSAFSSGTSTTSDIEVLDHESVQSESSASSRQEIAEAKAGLHLMQGSFQLLSASACGDFPRLEDYPKLTESCGSSSDAFERIDSFSMQSLDSRSVSEVNSDDDIPGSRTLASVTAGPTPSPPVRVATTAQVREEEEKQQQQEEEEDEEGLTETMKDQSLDENEMEESGRSATPVNSEQPEDLIEQESEADVTLSGPTPDHEEQLPPPITEEKRGVSTCQILELQKVIDELSSRLEKRELQLLSVSKDKARLEEECDNLKDEVIGLKEESSSVQSLKEEFTQRIADTERKAQLACKERDIAKKEIKGMREELSTRLNSNETMEIIREKEEQIRELLEEGEKLSKQQLQHSNIIKKLRVKEKESETKITKQNKKLKEQEEELKHLQQVLDEKEEVEKQHRDNIKKLNVVVERQEKDMTKLQSDSEELLENNRSLQAALDNSYKEMAALHKAKASHASEAQEAALSRETQAKEELVLALVKAQEEARMQQDALVNQVADLRLALQRAEQQQARKEDYLREEISDLQQRLQGAETRNQELSQSVTSATRPLLRQIENLQASLGGQTASWEKLEKSISDRLVEAQAQLAVAVEKERAATEELMAIKAQLASLESQNSLLRQEKGRLHGQLDAEKTRREKLEDDSSREHVELENLRGAHTRTQEEAKKEKLLLTNQLEMEKMKVEQEKKKCYLAQEALKEKERKVLVHSVGEPPASSTPSLSRSSSISGVDHAGLHSSFSQEDSLGHSLGTMTMSMSGTNLYEAARLSGGSSIIENLQSQLKLREGEIAQLQLEIASLERTRSSMAEEMVRLTNQNEEMEDSVKEIPTLKVQLQELEQRHNTILQMYGEKAEEAEELRLDLEDVKNMFKTQIDELLKNQK
ncbi:TATA element modulatory factor isoform X1 [Salmo salar]|uniref:TATA element modulatory factor isoform X1 n=1 Tax=Salmo salar TaxID=8030 RepID=A0A1S3LEE4_SALSA|nr:TATA element modulatory factor isoform X1 [Salmo salar]|eukprot:XP_013988874.1 PREDICTED: TATA element modulatory factor isoform X1 [Salmo salar]